MGAPTELGTAETLLAVYMEQQDWDAVIRISDWALGIDPYDIHLHQVQLTALMAQARHDDALARLAILMIIDGQNEHTYRLKKAQTLAKSNRIVLAKREVLMVLEEVPHFWDAQALLLELNEF